MAARAGPKAILVHGTLLVSTDLAVLREHLSAPPSQAEALPPAPRHVRSRPWPETTVSAEAGRDVSLDEAIEAARSALRGRFGFGEWAGAAAPAPGEGKGHGSGVDD
jgi:lipoate-protein ligase A